MDVISETLSTDTDKARLRELVGELIVRRQRHEGREAELRRLTKSLDLSETDVRKLAAEIAGERAKAAAERTARHNPPFTDEGVPVSAPTRRDVFVLYGADAHDNHVPANALVIERLLSGWHPLPDFSGLHLHRYPAESEATFEYLVTLVRELAAGTLKPGKVCFVTAKGYATETLGMRTISAENLPIAFGENGLPRFVRSRGQTEAAFSKAVAAVEAAIAEEARRNLMPPPSSGGAAFGGVKRY